MTAPDQPRPLLRGTHDRLLTGFLSSSFHADVTIDAAEPVSTGSRNSLLRLRLGNRTDGGPPTVIAKHVTRETDIFFAHHLRREERLLDLLHRFAPGLAPHCVGLLLHPAEEGWLLMEDVGHRSLADALVTAAPDTGVELLHRAAQCLRLLHDVLRQNHGPFYRTCYAVDLDRLTSTSLHSRLRVAWKRLSTHLGSVSEPPPGLVRAWLNVLRPLLDQPRQLIHNSLSPLNIVLRDGGGMALVDFETMTLGAPEFDTAELLRQPFWPLSWDDSLRLASVESTRDTSHVADRLHVASLSRALDYAGSNARQLATQAERGTSPETRQHIQSRLHWYCTEVHTLIDTWPTLSPLRALIETTLVVHT